MNELTGTLYSSLEFRVLQQDANSTIEDHGKILYNIPLTSGTGIAAVNQLYHNDCTHTTNGIENIDLSGIAYFRAGYSGIASFVYAGGGEIKGVYIQNNSANNLGLRYPWYDGYVTIPPSSSRFTASDHGWIIPASGYLLQTSGNGTIQNYTLSLLGSANPATLKQSFDVETEHIADVTASGISVLEYLSNLSGVASSSQVEWINSLPSAVFSGRIEFLSEPLIDNTGIYEYLGGVKRNNTIPFAYLGNSGVPVAPLLNQNFVLAGSGNISNSGTNVYSYWYNEWDSGGTYKVESLDGNSDQTNDLYYDNIFIYTTNNQRTVNLGEQVPNPVKFYQNMSLISGSGYSVNFTLYNTYSPDDYQGNLCHVRLKKLSNGNIIYDFEQPAMSGTEVSRDISFSFVAPESGVRLEFEVPERTSWLANYDSSLSISDRYKKYKNYLSFYDLSVDYSG